MHRVTVVVRVVAPAPFEAAPDAPACASELATHQPRSGSLPRDNIDQYCEVRLAANSTSIRLSPDSAAWFRGAEGRQVLACLPCMYHRRGIRKVLGAPVRAQHHPDNMRPRRHCSCSPTRCRDPRCGSHSQREVKQSAQSVPSTGTECAEGLAEMWRGALERGGVQKTLSSDDLRMRRKSEPSVSLLTGVEMQDPAETMLLY